VHSLSTEEIYTIPRWLDRGGVIVYFPDIPVLCDNLFLHPDQLAKKIYEILNKDILAKGGEFAENDILHGKDTELNRIFLEVAKHLNLIFPHPLKGKGFYIAPQYLPDQHPVDDLYKIASRGTWEPAFFIKIPLYYYKKVLHGLLLHFAGDATTDCRYFWKHGILFTSRGTGSLVKGLYPTENELDGVIMLSVEKNEQQSKLIKQIFEKSLEILGIEISDENVNSDSPVFDRSMALLKDIGLRVSYDGTHFASYHDLLKSPSEPKIQSPDGAWLLTKKFAPLLPFQPPKTKRVFLSYSHQNTKWLGRLRTHLAGLRRSKEIESWDDKEIVAGDQWDGSIKKKRLTTPEMTMK